MGLFWLLYIASSQVKEEAEGCSNQAAGGVSTNDVLSEFDLSKMSSLLKAEYGVDVTEESLKGAARASRLKGGAGKPLPGQEVVVRAKHGESSTLVSAITVDDNDGAVSSTGGVGTNAAHTAAAPTAAGASSGVGGISLRLLSSDEDDTGHSVGNGAHPSVASGSGGSGMRPFDPTDEHSPTSKKFLEELGLSRGTGVPPSGDDMDAKIPAVENTTKGPSPLEEHVTKKAASAARKPAAINSRKPSPSSKKQATTKKKATPTGKKTATKKTPTKKKSPSKRESSVEVSLSNVMGTFGAHRLFARFVCN